VSIKPIAALLWVAALFLLASSVSGQTTDDKLIADARAAYYNLARHGFNGFHAAIEPDWKVILADTATPENLKIFRSQHFSLNVDSNGAITVNREFDETQDTKPTPSVKQIYDNVQRLVTGFFGTWTFFMIRSPIPELQIRIESVDKEYRLFYKVQSTDVMLRMTRDFLITEGQLSDLKARRTLTPVFQKTSEGFLLLGYNTVFEPVAQGNKTTINTTIEYHDVGGVKLPGKIHIKGMYGVEPVEAELRFTELALTPPGNQ